MKNKNANIKIFSLILFFLSTTSIPCDPTPFNFYNKSHPSLILLKLNRTLSLDIQTENDEFGEGIGRQIRESLRVLYRESHDFFNKLRRHLGQSTPFSKKYKERWAKIKMKIKKDRDLYVFTEYPTAKFSDRSLDFVLNKLKVKEKDRLKAFKKKLKEAKDMLFKDKSKVSTTEWLKRFDTLQKDYSDLKKNSLLNEELKKSFGKKFKKNKKEIKSHFHSTKQNLIGALKKIGKDVKGADLIFKNANLKIKIEDLFLKNAKEILSNFERLTQVNGKNTDEIFENIQKLCKELKILSDKRMNLINNLKKIINKYLQPKYKQKFQNFMKKHLNL